MKNFEVMVLYAFFNLLSICPSLSLTALNSKTNRKIKFKTLPHIF